MAEVTNTQMFSHISYSVQMPDQLSDQEGLCPCPTGRWKDIENPNGPSQVSYTHRNFMNGLGRWASRAPLKQEEIRPNIYKSLLQDHTGSLLNLSWSGGGAKTNTLPGNSKRECQVQKLA